MEHVGHAGASRLVGRFLGFGVVAEEVAVEGDGHVLGLDVGAGAPQTVTQGGDPAGMELARAPQLVEGAVDEDDQGHATGVRYARRMVAYRATTSFPIRV